MKSFLIFCFNIVSLIGFSNDKDFRTDSLFMPEIFYSSNCQDLPFQILKPSQIEQDKKYPLVIFLHGAGERGVDNQKQLLHGSSLFKGEFSKKNPAYVIFPQCPEGRRWVEVDWKLTEHKMPEDVSLSLHSVMELKERMLRDFPIDYSRIYIMGLSMGGFGTWDLICRFPDQFAAAVTICGGGDESKAYKLKNVPVWAFHGSEDRLVKPCRSLNMVNAIKENGGHPKYTEYKNVGHLSWNNAFSEPDLLNWLFKQSLD